MRKINSVGAPPHLNQDHEVPWRAPKHTLPAGTELNDAHEERRPKEREFGDGLKFNVNFNIAAARVMRIAS
jgi:hypothetical protein